jgi:hypothetical protein
MENTSATTQQRVTTILQILFFILVCGGAVYLAINFGLFKSKDSRSVTIHVENSSGDMQIMYTLPNDTVSEWTRTSSPWDKYLIIKKDTEIYVSAANPNGDGIIKCFILLEGKAWKKDSAIYPADKISCAGIIP